MAKTFAYLQLLDRAGLSLYLCDVNGPFSPSWVAYTLLEKKPDGLLQQVGPSRRTPASGNVGEFYATGRAGEMGQCTALGWLIRWEFMVVPDSPIEVREESFMVEDAVLATYPQDITVRAKKYGWL